jgi:glutaminase
MKRNYKEALSAIDKKLDFTKKEGSPATYIPELAKVNPDQFGLYLYCLDDANFSLGTPDVLFSIQSISKVFTLTMALERIGADIWKRVGVEPSGTAFNSLVQLEHEQGLPRNPLINAGAIVIADMLVSIFDDPKAELLQFVRKITGDDSVNYDYSVAQSEFKTGHRNFAMANLLKSFGNMENDVDTVLDFYFHQCSLSMNCKQLARAFALYANGGIEINSNKRIISEIQSKRINALMMSCGFYDEAGEFAFSVGLPGKSGVGGGIAAVHPGEYSVVTWSPRLNEKGNSVLGMKSLEVLTTKTEHSIF